MKLSLLPNILEPIFVNPTYCQIQGLLSRHYFCIRIHPADHNSGHSVGFAIRRSPYGKASMPFPLLRTPSVLRGSNFDLAATVVLHLRHLALRCKKGIIA